MQPINDWKKDIAVIVEFRSYLSDTLDVVDGHFSLQKKNSVREKGSPMTNQPDLLADQLQSLICNKAKEHFLKLFDKKQCDESAAYYEKLVDFKKELKTLNRCLCDLQSSFVQCGDKVHANRYYILCETSEKLYKLVKQSKSEQKEPPINARPVKHLVYNERTDARSISWRHKRGSVDEIVIAAKNALALSYGSSVLSGSVSVDVHVLGFQKLVSQLTHTPVISDEFIRAFKELAPFVKELDLERATLASKKITEMAPLMEDDKRIGAIPLSTYLEKMEQVCEKRNITPSFMSVELHYQ